MDRTKIKQFILQLSSEAGEFLRNNFYTIKSASERPGGGIATNIDWQLEAIIVARLEQAFPEHGIKVIGGSQRRPEAAYQWIIDPLDGSSHFSRNIPIYTCNIAWQENGQTVLGTVNYPQTHQLFFAERGEGAYLNGISIKVSENSDLSSAFIFVELPEQKFAGQESDPQSFAGNTRLLHELIKKSGQVESWRIGALGQCLVASGAFDAYLDLSGSSQKMSQLASRLIVQEAGGKIAELKTLQPDFTQVMAANEQLAKVLTDLISETGL